MISVEHLTKRYGPTLAVSDVSFEVRKGEILGFLGPNGAGKTTTMRVITGYLMPSAGSVQVEGMDVAGESLAVRKLVGYLEYSAQLQGVDKASMPRRLREMVQTCGLGEMIHKDLGQLSKGYRQRV